MGKSRRQEQRTRAGRREECSYGGRLESERNRERKKGQITGKEQ